MDSLAAHRAYLEQAWRASQAAPLSARKAALVAALIDAYVDHQFAATAAAEDILHYRAQRAASSPALALVMALCSQRQVHIVTEAVTVPIAEYGALGVEDFMVSLYNDNSVQRVLLALADGRRRDMQETLRQAIVALEAS